MFLPLREMSVHEIVTRREDQDRILFPEGQSYGIFKLRRKAMLMHVCVAPQSMRVTLQPTLATHICTHVSLLSLRSGKCVSVWVTRPRQIWKKTDYGAVYMSGT